MRELTATSIINMKQQSEKTTVQGNKRAVFCVHVDLVIEQTTNPPNINTTAKFFHVYVRMLMYIIVP